ncbi:hypothetical protein BXZ70DRAFT_910809 [Cristinia sonorae]|uniref:Uncharacterized protein n=1 Tax=Cristinia sonorae TaxID=1940300 RepID=A0A8K0UEK9_9AGAR|nr:hypothetical protein BXZ70DRAFT_910809 [Cristinia sonorae]
MKSTSVRGVKGKGVRDEKSGRDVKEFESTHPSQQGPDCDLLRPLPRGGFPRRFGCSDGHTHTAVQINHGTWCEAMSEAPLPSSILRTGIGPQRSVVFAAAHFPPPPTAEGQLIIPFGQSLEGRMGIGSQTKLRSVSIVEAVNGCLAVQMTTALASSQYMFLMFFIHALPRAHKLYYSRKTDPFRPFDRGSSSSKARLRRDIIVRSIMVTDGDGVSRKAMVVADDVSIHNNLLSTQIRREMLSYHSAFHQPQKYAVMTALVLQSGSRDFFDHLQRRSSTSIADNVTEEQS